MSHDCNVSSSRVRTGNTPVYPWYKQRLFIKSSDPKNKQKLSGALNSRRWRFLNSGLDDFRDGYPLNTGQEIFASSQCGTSPVVFGKTGVTCPSTKVKRPTLTKEQVCFSKKNPLKQMRRERVDAVEKRLAQHPLALYPHLESGMAPELFDEVLLVLEPDMYVRKRSAPTSEKQEHKSVCESERTLPKLKKDEGSKLSVEEMLQEPNQRNPYKLKDTKTSWDKEDQRISVKSLCMPSQDENIKKVTKALCDWVISLGGDTNNLTESTVLGMFDSGYEKKSSVVFPTEVVKPNDIPEELRGSAKQQGRLPISDTLLKDSDLPEFRTGSTKTKFGAWYLDPKLWKKRPANEPLRDPSEVEKEILLKEQPSALDDKIKQLHITQELKQFITSRGQRMPRFLRTLVAEDDKESKGRGTDTAGSMPAQR